MYTGPSNTTRLRRSRIWSQFSPCPSVVSIAPPSVRLPFSAHATLRNTPQRNQTPVLCGASVRADPRSEKSLVFVVNYEIDCSCEIDRLTDGVFFCTTNKPISWPSRHPDITDRASVEIPDQSTQYTATFSH